MLILSPAQADQVRGLTAPGHALAPRPLADGTFALPDAVLTDPFHAKHVTFLGTVNVRLDNTIRAGTRSVPNDPNSPLVNSDWSQDQALLAATSYKQEWPVGEAVTVNPTTLEVTAGGDQIEEPKR